MDMEMDNLRLAIADVLCCYASDLCGTIRENLATCSDYEKTHEQTELLDPDNFTEDELDADIQS